MTPLLHVLLCPLQSLGSSQREYEKHVLLYSIRNQLRFRNNLGETARFSTQTAAAVECSPPPDGCCVSPSSATREEGRAQVLRGAAEVQPGAPDAVPLPPV